jgi:hypothetical protein
MTPETKIQLAADFIRGEFDKRGAVISEADALAAARKLHHAWERQADVNYMTLLSPGEIARHFRKRYDGSLETVSADIFRPCDGPNE